MKFEEGLDKNIGKFKDYGDCFTTPFFTKDYCDNLIMLSEEHGFEIDENGNYDLLLHKIKDGEKICKSWLATIKKYLEPKILEVFTVAIKNRLWDAYPVPFIKKFSMDGQTDLSLHSDNSILTIFVKLNDENEGCLTVFPRQNWDSSQMKVGEVGIWPGSITHPHYTTKLESGVKYSLVGRSSILIARKNEFDDISKL